MVEDMDMRPGRLDKVLILIATSLLLAISFVIVYYVGAYNTVDDMKVMFRDFGEVTLEFNGFVYPKCFDVLFGGK